MICIRRNKNQNKQCENAVDSYRWLYNNNTTRTRRKKIMCEMDGATSDAIVENNNNNSDQVDVLGKFNRHKGQGRKSSMKKKRYYLSKNSEQTSNISQNSGYEDDYMSDI